MQGKTKWLRLGVIAVMVLVVASLLYIVYFDVKERTIDDYNAQQMLIAKQATNAIKENFGTYRNELFHLSSMYNIKVMNQWSENILANYYEINSNKILAVTRMDSVGKIVFTYPPNPNTIGSDITYQKHVQQILKTHEPVISDVFTSVQGFRCIAYHIPVFLNKKFMGSLAVLVPFKYIAEMHLDKIQIGQNSYTWIMSEHGIELYCQDEDHIGEYAQENFENSPSVKSMISKMMQGKQGNCVYYDNHGKTYHAVYYPIHLENTFWSITLASPESQVLATMRSFQLKMLFFAATLFFFGVIYTYYFIGVVRIVNEEKKRKQIEQALLDSEEKFRELSDLLPQIVYESDLDGNITYANKHAFMTFGYTIEELAKGIKAVDMLIPQDRERAAKNIHNALMGDLPNSHNEYTALRKDGKQVPVLIYSSIIFKDNQPLGLRGIVLDITERKKTEEQIQKSLHEKEILLKEIHHRVKNNLNVISSLLALQAKRITNKQEALAAFKESRDRVFSIAQVHEQLYKSNDFTKIDMKAYIESLSKELGNIYARDKEILLKLDINNIRLDVNQAVPCGLILNELITNSYKHAFPGTHTGEITVHFQSIPDYFEIIVRDNGVGLPGNIDFENNDTLGLQLISVLTRQIDGTVTFENTNGSQFIIRFPATGNSN